MDANFPPSAVDQIVPGSARGKIAAVLEVLGVYAAGQLAGYLIAKLLGIPLVNPLTALTPQASPVELMQITGKLVLVLLLQYAGWFVLILPLGWWHRRRGPAQYGLTLNNQSARSLILTGVVLFAFANVLEIVLGLVNTYFPLGAQAAWREAIFAMKWNTAEFWVFMAAGSFVLVPILEELFYRGYCQTRLEEDFGAPTAIFAVAALFTLSHSQYYIVNVLNLGILVTSIMGSIAWGYIFYRTRSLLPVIVAHALANLPIRGIAGWGQIASMLIVCILARKEIVHALREFMTLVRDRWAGWEAWAVIASCALFAVAFVLSGDAVILGGLLFFVAAVVLVALEKRRRKRFAM